MHKRKKSSAYHLPRVRTSDLPCSAAPFSEEGVGESEKSLKQSPCICMSGIIHRLALQILKVKTRLQATAASTCSSTLNGPPSQAGLWSYKAFHKTKNLTNPNCLLVSILLLVSLLESTLSNHKTCFLTQCVILCDTFFATSPSLPVTSFCLPPRSKLLPRTQSKQQREGPSRVDTLGSGTASSTLSG